MHTAWKLQMNRTKKLLVIAVFTFGLWYAFCLKRKATAMWNHDTDLNSAPVFSTVGFVYRIKYSDSVDTTWTQPDLLLWA